MIYRKDQGIGEKNLVLSQNKNIFRKFASLCEDVLNNSFGFVFILFILNIITQTCFLLLFSKFHLGRYLQFIFIVLFQSFFLATLLQLIKNKILLNIIKGSILLVSLLCLLIESFLLNSYHVLVHKGIINVVLESNSKEMKEYLLTYLPNPHYFFYIIVSIAIVAIVKILIDRYSGCIIKKRTVISVILLIGMLLTIRGSFIQPVGSSMLYRFYVETKEALVIINAYRDLYANVNTNVNILKNESKIKNIVLIMGESTNRNHMAIYGYQNQTTPKLQELLEQGNIKVFDDIISPHSHTSPVLAKFFTFSNYESKDPWYKQQNMISIFNRVGYETFWLSNQESSGVWGNVAQIFSDLSKNKFFTKYRDSQDDNLAPYDEALLPVIDQSLAKKGEKNFYVIHLMGTHGGYKYRYPTSFNRFQEKDIQTGFSKGKYTVAEYDNAILYNDYVVNEIINKFSNDEAIVIYVADHGEEVYDFRDFAGHSEDNGSRHMIEIPMVVWFSDQFTERYPDKVRGIERAVHKPYMTDDMIHTILDLADIKTPEFDESRSLFSDKYDEKRKRIYHMQDYDMQLKGK